MSEYVPKPDAEDINAPVQTTPWRDVLILIGGFFVIFFIFLFVIGFVTEKIISRVDIQTKIKWFQKLNSVTEKNKGTPETTDALKNVHDKIRAHIFFPVQLSISCDADANAFAYPGGKIVLTSGLFKALKTENALVFVVGHEIGHFVHRDHLRGFGHKAAISILMSLLGLGSDASGLLNLSQMPLRHFQQGQEAEADEYALKLVKSIYGHTRGSEEFFEYVSQKESSLGKIFLSWASTHPPTESRLQAVKSSYSTDQLPELIDLAEPLTDMSFCKL